MGTPIDSLQALYDRLAGAVQGTAPDQRLTLDAALFAAAGELVDQLGLRALTLRQRADGSALVTLDRAAATVRVVGDAELFPDGRGAFAYGVTIAGTYTTRAVLVLDGRPADPASWTLAGNFAAPFPGYEGVDDDRITWLDSFLPEAVFDAPAFVVATAGGSREPGLWFEGRLDLTRGSLAVLRELFGTSTLPIEGRVTLRAGTYPLLDLHADPGYAIPQLLDVGLVLGTQDATGEAPAQTTLELVGRPPIGGAFDDVTISAPVLQGTYAWVLTATTDDPAKYSVASGLAALARFASGQTLTLPAGFDALGAMYLESVTVGFAPSETPDVDLIGFRIASDPRRTTLWSAPILGLAVESLAVQWDVVGVGSGEPTLLGSMSGSLLIGPAPSARENGPTRLGVAVALSELDAAFAPDVTVSVELDPDTPLSVSSLFRQFTGVDLDLGLLITDMRMEAETGPRTLQFVVELELDWDLRVPVRLDRLSLLFRYAPNAIAATMVAHVRLVGLGFMLGAAYRGAGAGWLFAGGLLPQSQGASLGEVLGRVAPGWFPERLPANLGAIELRDMWASFDTAADSYSFDGVVGWPFSFDAFTLDLEAALSLEKRTDEPVTGSVRGTLRIDSFSAAVVYAFGVQESTTIAFEIAWRGMTLTCVYARDAKGRRTLRANLGGVSFGDILAYLVGLALPGGDFQLPAPWDVLYRLRFDDLWLEVDLDTRAIGFTYAVGVDLGIARIDAIGLTYARRAGSPSIDVTIAGRFLDSEFPAEDPLAWDLLNDPAPTPPGKGDALLDLRYLALGQNVAFRDATAFGSVLDAIDALRADFAPVDETTNPLESLPALKFSGDGRWLIGADFTVMSAVSIAGVFADPALYGLRVGLAGEKVGALAGLEFEILYKKVSETVGVYHLELTLPQAMRQLQFGAIAVTVPVVGIDVYTNGDFRLDLGFPAGRDFSRSFCVQGGPFVGYGGFYLALLDGATSERVPQVVNGTFSPVVEFGLGLSVGLGRTFEQGPLKAGATVTMEAFAEGVLAWFNPHDRSRGSDLYYAIQGTAALVGKVFGSVDFFVVKARISIVASASVTLTVRSHAPIEVQFQARVEVSASIEVLFFTITFSFTASLDLSFTIGSVSPTPWIPQTADAVRRPLQLRQQRVQHSVPPPRPIELLRALRDAAGEQPAFDWTPRPLLAANGPVDVDLLLVPALTPALEPPSGTPAAVQVSMSLLVPTATPAAARHADEVLRVEHAAPADVPFNRLAAGVLRWAIGALRKRPDGVVFRSGGDAGASGERVTIADLDAIAAFLADRANRDATFTYARVRALIEQNFRLRISNPIGPDGTLHDAGSDVPRGATAPNVQGAAFPMIPEIAMTPQQREPVRFWAHALANDDYRAFLETYYDQLSPDAEANVAADPFAARSDEAGPVGLASGRGLEAVGTTVFSDWFALLAQQSIALAIELLDAYPCEPTGAETLREIADAFDGLVLEHRTRPGDTAATVAAAFGQRPAALRAANPWIGDEAHDAPLPVGSTVRVDAGPSPETIAAANGDYPLRPGARLTVSGVRCQAQADDTLSSIADAFGIGDVTALLTDARASANASNRALLQAGASLTVPAFDYVVTAADAGPADALDRIAATFFTRGRLRPLDDAARAQIAWYVAALGQRNPVFAGTVEVPIARIDDDGHVVDTGRSTTYAVRPGDTLADVAATFALLQLAAGDPVWRAFRAAVRTTPPQPQPLAAGAVVHVPALVLPLRAGDTFRSLATAFAAAPGGPDGGPDPLPAALAALARANAGAAVLAPLAVLALPAFQHPIAAGDTLAAVARRYDLTLSELAESVADDSGILLPYDGERRLSVPHVAARELDRLVDDLVAFGSFNALSATASRFLLGGMRAPAPGPTGAPEGSLRGVADVIGQQFPAPFQDGPAGPAGATAPYEIALAKGTTAPWFEFEPPAGMRAARDGAGEDATVVRLTPEFVAAHSPSATLDPLTVTGPAPMPPYELVGPRYAIDQSVPWQTPTAIPLPEPGPTGPEGGSAGGPSLWLLPRTLTSRLAAGPAGATGPSEPYELVAAQRTPDGRTGERVLDRFAWATAIPLQIARAHDGGGAVVPGAYEIAGADSAAREALLQAWTHLAVRSSPRDRLFLLRGSGTAGENDGGLVSDTLVAERTFVLRTNLSTETRSGARGAAANAPSGEYYARIDAIGDFLKTVWEAVVTGTGGFHLTYGDSAGAGLPETLFSGGGTTTIWALLLLDEQSRRGAPERGLYRFNTCAVVADNLDASATTVIARPRRPAAAELRRVASMPPGVVGFGLARRNPAGATAPGPTGLTQRLHSLVGYQVEGGDDFAASHEGLPIGPLDDPPAWLRLPPGPTHAYWSYEQVVPVAQFGAANDCPDVAGLPPAAANPYRGITGPSASGDGRPLSSARLGFAFHDVYGNTTTATAPLSSLDVPVGYTDDLIAVGAWPGSGLAYRFAPASEGDGAVLETTLTLQLGRYLPGSGGSHETAVRTASADAERYRQIYYQLQQADATFALGANVGVADVAPDDLRAALTAFATKAKLFADAAATLRLETAPTVAGETLAALARRLSVTPEALAEANAEADAAALFPATYVKPHVLAAPAMNTLASLAELVVGRCGEPGPPSCAAVPEPDASCSAGPALRAVWPGEQPRSLRAAAPHGAGDPAGVAADNAARPLTPGTVLRTLPRTSPPLDAARARDSLAGIAAWLGAPIDAFVAAPEPGGAQLEVGLLVDNWTASGLVADGVRIAIDGHEHTTHGDTLASVYAFFADRSRSPQLTRGDLGAALAELPGIFAAGATVAHAALVVPQPPPPSGPAPAQPVFALADVPAAAGTVAQLAALNVRVPNLFALGTPLLLGWSCCRPAAGDTLRTLAEQARIALAVLAAANAATPLGGDVAVNVPDVVRLPRPEDCRTAYAPRVDDSLATIAAALGTPAAALAEANRRLPGIFRTGAVLTVGAATVRAGARDSLQSAFARAGSIAWDAFVQALEQPVNRGVYRPEGALLAPLPAVPGSGDAAPAIDALARRLGVEPAALLDANRTLRGVLREGASIHGPAHEGRVTAVIVGPFDTVASVLRRLGEPGREVTVAELIDANAGRTGLLAVGAPLLLPPAPTALAVAFAPRLPPAGASGEEQVVFSVDVWLELARSRGLVHPDFADTESVWRVRSALPPRVGGSGDTRLTLDAFATAFERAFAAQRLKCAVAASGAAGGPDGAQGDVPGGQIWAVNFGAGGVSRFAVDAAQPMFYALAPLSTEPVGGDVAFPSYVSGEGLCADVTKRFENVDLDAWMRELLGTVDLALTPSYAVPAFGQGATGPLGARPAAPAAAPELAVPALPLAEPPAPDPLAGPMGLVHAAEVSAPVLGSFRSGVGGAVGASGCTGPPPSGPADYDRLVAAKAGLAAALRERVEPIVEAPGATGQFEQEWARETLYQQLLVRLGDAYDVSAVMQFPVDVASPLPTPPPGATGPAPPRLSGKVVPVLRTVPAVTPAAAGDVPPTSLAAVAAGYGVSVPYLAQVVGNLEGLLAPGAVIVGQRVAERDTLNRIAAAVGVPTDPARQDYWEFWAPFVDSFAGAPVLGAGASFPLTAAARSAGPGETLTAIGEFFDRDVVSVGRANQDRPGTVRPGSLTVPGYPEPYTVLAGDSLSAVAAGVSARNRELPPLTVDALCRLFADAPLLAPGAQLRIVEELPEVALSTAKVSLGRVGSAAGPRPPLSFLLTVKEVAQRAKLLLNLDFAINELEYGIRAVLGAGRYQASSWLTFVRPFEGDGAAGVATEIAQVQVPIPLRAYPPPSVLAAQSGLASDPGADRIPAARRWDYRFDVQTRKAAQDTDHLRVTFGERSGRTLDAAVRAELLRWLAAFVDAGPALKDDLARLPALAPGARDAVAAHAVQALAIVAENVARALRSGRLTAAAGPSGADVYAYRVTTLTDGRQLKTLTLDPEPPGPTGGVPVWPLVYVRSPTAQDGDDGPDAGFLPLGGAGGVYDYPGGFFVDEQQTYRFRFPERDVIRNRTGRGAIAVSRNDRLIPRGPLGPTGPTGPVATNEAFVYRTPFAQFADPLVPLLETDAPIDVAALAPDAGPRPLATHLLNLLGAATDVIPGGRAEGAQIELLCAYGFVVGDGGMLVRTPLQLVPARTIAGGDVAAFADALAASLAAWRRSTEVDDVHGLLAFDLSVFARDLGGDGPEAAQSRPILRLRDLRLPFGAIRWPDAVSATQPQLPNDEEGQR